MAKKQVEVEGGEIAIRNSHGDIAIIPRNKVGEAEKLIKDGCNDCLDSLVSKLPTLASHAQDGTVVPEEQPAEQPTMTREEYLQSFVEKTDTDFYKKNGQTPFYTDGDFTTENSGMNCINGVCTQIGKVTGKKWDDPKKTYVGNQSFNDARSKEGFYDVDPRKEGFSIGDIVQDARYKENAERFEGKVTEKNRFDLLPQHAKLITNTRATDDGGTEYQIGHNGGNQRWNSDWITEEKLFEKYYAGYEGKYKDYDGMIISRYDPERVAENAAAKAKNEAIMSGDNDFADQYDVTPEDRKLLPGKVMIADGQLEKQEELMKYFDKNYKQVGKGSNLPPELLRKMALSQTGIAAQESKFGTSDSYAAKAAIPDMLIDEARAVKGSFSDDKDGWISDYWKKDVNGVREQHETEDNFRSYITEEYGNPYESDARRAHKAKHAKRSRGMFQQKDLSVRGAHNKLNLKDTEGQFLSSLNLQIDNYHAAKEMYPDLSEEQLLDVSILMHNAPGKAKIKEYVDYYIKNNDSDYVNKVKERQARYKKKTYKENTAPRELSDKELQATLNFINGLK